MVGESLPKILYDPLPIVSFVFKQFTVGPSATVRFPERFADSCLFIWRAFLESPGNFSGPKSYVMCKMFTNKDSFFVDFES